MRFERIRRRLRLRCGDAGSNLVELVVTIAVLSIVMAMIFGIVINVVNNSNEFRDRTQEQADTRLAIDALVRDLRQSYTDKPTLAAVDPTSTASRITFYSPNRDINFRLRKITYDLTGGTLTRSVSTSANTAADVVGKTAVWTFDPADPVPVLTGVLNASLFSYKNATNGPWPGIKPLAAVQIDLVIDQSPGRSPTPQTYHTEVAMRVIHD